MSESYHLLDDTALNELLTLRRGNLMRLEMQAANYASGQEPLELYNKLQAEQAVVQQLLAEQERRRSQPVAVATVVATVQPVAILERDQPQAGAIGNSLLALSELVRMPPVRAALVAFRTDFQSVSAHIGSLSSYKHIHDLFQQLEGFYEQLIQGCKRLPADDTAWEDIEANEPGLHDVADELLHVASQAAFAPKESLWMRRLDRARGDLRAAVEASEVERLREAVQRIYEDVIDREMSRVNTRLVESARALHFDALLAALSTVRGSLGSSVLAPDAAQQFEAFVSGLSALQQLEVQLRTLVTCHDTFQSLDDELRRVRDTIEHDPTELEFAWADIKPLAEQLVAASQADWALKLGENSASLDAAIVGGDWNKTRRVFLRYRSHVNRSFTQIDKDLLDLCGQLQSIGQPLNLIVQLID